jgi:hypothetical protein
VQTLFLSNPRSFIVPFLRGTFCKPRDNRSANLLSNTAQALTSYVEALQDSSTIDPLQHLDEALQLFQKCLKHQERQHREFEEQSAAADALAAQEIDTVDGGVSLNTGSAMDVDEPGMSFSIPLGLFLQSPLSTNVPRGIPRISTNTWVYRHFLPSQARG